MPDKNNARRSTKLLSLIISVCLVSACYIKQKTAEEVSDELNSLIYPEQRNSKYEIEEVLKEILALLEEAGSLF